MRRSGDSGQAFPVYIAVIAGLLFLAFAYYLVGQAALTRSSAQTAADAAALAAAQDAREQLHEGWIEVILDPGQWDRFLQGVAYTEASACRQAAEFAARNEAALTGDQCMPLATGEHGFKVTVSTTGRESHHATASAEAVLEPRCTFDAPKPTQGPSGPTPGPTPTSPDEDGGEPVVGLVCDGEPWVIDPDSSILPGAADLFRVRLSD
ncbi:pilus assembly protein TadG-related protein [Streptomyces sp. TLI_105]|uniref:pilus assembly protein TadG-related protein n=1 Tax=Streptomyces sp. TLI_105 TaxID=1881019 RepID=UPI000B86E4CB|nr:pilus assembly protein TadG-related protein [Streptomyces sp. TLI_105]